MQISLFEKITHARVKDCFEDSFGQLTFCVLPGQLHKAIGKNAATIKKLDKLFKRKLRIIEYSDKLEKFIENLCYPNKVDKVEFAEQSLWDETKKIVTVLPSTHKSRGYIIGREASNLRNIESIAKRYFKVDEIKVIAASDSPKAPEPQVSEDDIIAPMSDDEE